MNHEIHERHEKFVAKGRKVKLEKTAQGRTEQTIPIADNAELSSDYSRKSSFAVWHHGELLLRIAGEQKENGNTYNYSLHLSADELVQILQSTLTIDEYRTASTGINAYARSVGTFFRAAIDATELARKTRES